MSNLELNKGDNFIFGVDVSGSMQTPDCPGGVRRIEYLKEKTIQFAHEASKYDTDGIDVLTFGHRITPYLGVTGDKAAEIIGKLQATEASTDTAALIREAYALHKKGNKEQTVLFIATDGEPNDREAVKTEIRRIAAEIPKGTDGGESFSFAISFLTVGKISPDLQAFLTDLDDNLNAAQDIVDVKPLEEVDFMSAFIGALHD